MSTGDIVTPQAIAQGNVKCPVHGEHGLVINGICGRCAQDGTPSPFKVVGPGIPLDTPPQTDTGGTV